MAENAKSKRIGRLRRAKRVRRRLHGTPERPRLTVFRSNRHIAAQLVDDENGRTLAAATDLKMEAPSIDGKAGKVARAMAVGTELAKRATESGVSEVIFDRSGYKFHGRVAALAEGARDGGLKF